MAKTMLLQAIFIIIVIEFCWTGKVSSSSCQVYPSEYAYHSDSVYRSERASANCRRYASGLQSNADTEDYTHCDVTQLRLTDSELGSDHYNSSDYYVWSAWSSRQLLFIIPTRVNLTTITLHYYSDSSKGLPRLRFYAVPDDFDVWDAPLASYSSVDVASVPPGEETAGRRNFSVNLNYRTKKILMYKYRSYFYFSVSEVEFYKCMETQAITTATVTEQPATVTYEKSALQSTQTAKTNFTTVTTTEAPSDPLTPPVMKLISSLANPILTGSSLELICLIEWVDNVTDPVDIQVEWAGPNRAKTLHPWAIKVSSLRYISKIMIHSVEIADSGTYTCSVHIGNQLTFFAKTTLTVGDAVFQLRLKHMGDCHIWTHDKVRSLKTYIEEALIEAVERRCLCLFPQSQLLNGTFRCQSSMAQVTYRNTIKGTHSFNATQLVGFIQDWVNSGATVNMDWYSVGIDRNCPVAIRSLNDSECG